MRTVIAILFIFMLNSCSSVKEQHIIESKIQDTNLLRRLINQNKINGQIILNDFDGKVKVDSFVGVYVKYPFKQTYTIDSIYYLNYNDSNFKILAQSEFEKGLLYLEVDNKGNHTRFFSFGGYVTDVRNVLVSESKKNIELTFTVDTWASTMPDTVKQFIKIESNKNSIDFKIWNKFDKKDVWQSVITD